MRETMTPPRTAWAACLAAGVLVLAGCGSSAAGSSSGDGLPEVVNVTAIADLSGVAGPGGQPTRKGMELAAEEVNNSKFLASSTLKLEFGDSGTNPAKGASLMSKAASSDTPLAFGSSTSAVALAEAPIAQRGKLPVIFQQAGAEGVLEAGDRIYRATPLQTSYFNLTLEYLQKNSAKKVAVIYDNDVPTIVNLYKALTDGASKYGYEVVSTQSTTSKTVDVSSQVSKMLSAQPDAIFVDVLQAHNVQVIKQLRQSGYNGLIVAQQGAGGGTLEPLGADADGVVFANDFNAGSPTESTQHFVSLYKAKYNATPGNFAAEGYDAVWFAARALKEAGSVDRDAVLAALKKVGETGFQGALGDIKFVDRQEVLAKGVLVKLDAKAAESPIGQ
jgi:branched-chain amino acid transport system substrate-binding protein